MQKFSCAIFGTLTLLLLVQELIPQAESARVRVARVRKGRHDKRQTQQHLHGFTDVPLDDAYGHRRPREPQPQPQPQQRPEDNPYNAGNRNVAYPTRSPGVEDDGRYQPAAQGSRKPGKQSGEDYDCGEGCDGNGIPGEAGVDYPIYASLPKTNFDCKKQEWPGYYADTDAKCQVFWICQKNKGDAFLCPNGTLFNQQVYVCDWWYNVDCATAPDYYTRNQYIYAGPGIDLFGNQITVKQSVSVSSNDNRRPVAVSQTPRPAGSTASGGQSNRELLQAIESGTNSGAGGNAFRREIGHRDDNHGSYSTPRITGSKSNADYQTSTYSSREAATNIPIPYEPYEKYVLRDKPTTFATTTKRYSSEQLSYGSKKIDHTYADASQTNAPVILSPSPSKSYGARENQIQNPFIKQNTSPRVPETSSRRTTSVSTLTAAAASGPSAPLKPYQQHQSQASQTVPPRPPQQQPSQYTSSSSPTSAPFPAKHYTPPPQLQQQAKYNKDNYVVALQSSYVTENNGYLPTTTNRPISTGSGSTNYNPFLAQNSNNNNNYKSNQYQQSSSSARPSSSADYYTTTPKKNVGFENDQESGFKFNFAKTISYPPSATSTGGSTSGQLQAPQPYRSHYNGSTIPKSTIFATTIRPNNANVYHHNPNPTIVQTTTRRPPPSTTYDGVTYAASANAKFVPMSSREVNTNAYNSQGQDYRRSGEQVNYHNNEYQIRKAVGTGGGGSDQDDYYHYRRQQQLLLQQQQPKEKYTTTRSVGSAIGTGPGPSSTSNTFQGDKIVSKYNTKTSYNVGDDENYVELLRSLSRLGKESATLAPVVQIHHRYDPETSATISSPVAVHTYDFTGTTTSTPRPHVLAPAYETTGTTTAAPTFGKKIKSGRKRNTSNWQNYFFKSKSS